ncbi:aminopeptidase N [Rhizomonospora bruguierae]|uniref:aminopeptidase N n=1 Tax=Rhizomonospora bruguierae TaxID=1581705 RepID=UPI001BCB6148|nr:aminopeptidase N [Micromonospora sp. NBRC 107566]
MHSQGDTQDHSRYHSLTRAEADERAALLDPREYDIDLDLTGPESFRSRTVIRFRAARPGATAFVELKPVRLRSARLNGAELDPATLAGNRLPLPDLAAENELVVDADMAYSRTGEGLHRFTDPADGATYVYAQSFLDDAQRTFACFDQPDLKAEFTVRVTADPAWTVLGNAPGERVGPGRWEFERTRRLSPYLIVVAGGPYHGVHAEHSGPEGPIPLGLYCRASLAEHLDRHADELMEITRGCLDEYHRLFAVPYPFGKYDQLFVPEFNAGAMENPGLVTLRDEFVFRSAVTESEREQRAAVIAHEMAHMWFGDLVTMRWWDDLWLNESFAEYLGYRVTGAATAFRETWTTFAMVRKGWGYAADQRPSTHPVAPEEVTDTAQALLAFDGISYAKGASVLRQLVAWVGDEAFLAGLNAHFAAHAYGNATLADLLGALGAASGRDLTGWAELWLRRPQVNTLRPLVEVAGDGSYGSVTVVQEAPPGYPTLRPHRIGIGLYAAAGAPLHRVEVDLDPATDDGRTPVPGLAGRRGDLLVLNDGDLTFAKVRLDERGLAALPTALPGLADPLTRAVIWGSVWAAVRDAELPITRMIDLLGATLPAEPLVTVVQDVLSLVLPAAPRFLPPERYATAETALAATCAAVLDAAPDDSHRLAAARGLIATTRDIALLEDWLAGTGVPGGLSVDADLRWAILLRLTVLDAVGPDRIDAELAADRSATGEQQAARCHAARPDADAKARAWDAIMNDDTRSNRLLEAAAEGFWQPGQEGLTAAYVPRFFAEANAMATRRRGWLAEWLSRFAFPRFAVAESTRAAAVELLARDDVEPGLRRSVVDLDDELGRALAARALATDGGAAG